MKRTDSEWLNLPKDKMTEVFLPTGATVISSQGDFRAKLENGEIEINYEDSGFHIIFEPYEGSKEEAENLVKTMLINLQAATNQNGEKFYFESFKDPPNVIKRNIAILFVSMRCGHKRLLSDW